MTGLDSCVRIGTNFIIVELMCKSLLRANMSRWIDGFENHAFQKSWKEIRKIVSSLSPIEGAPSPDIKEISRFKKVFTYVDELLESADVELVPVVTWNNFTNQSQNILNQLNAFKRTPNLSHITNANSYIDNILAYICPYVRAGKGAAQAAGKAFKVYSNSINQQISYLEKESKSAVEKTTQDRIKAERLLSEIKIQKDKIDALELTLLIGTKDDASTKKRMENLESEVSEWHDNIMEYHKKLSSGNEEESSIILQIETAKTNALASSEETQLAAKSASSTIDRLTNFHKKIFGTISEDGKKSGGLEKELKDKQIALENFQKTQETTYKNIKDDIETLLPGATAAGLASAYLDLKELFNEPIKKSTKLFYWALVGLFLSSLTLIVDKIGFWFFDLIVISDPKILLINVIQKLPVTIPFLWLTLFASKRISQSRRLQQEYAHKEALAKSYQSFKKQVEDVSTDSDNSLLKKLLETTIDTVGFNASITLDGKHNDKVPILNNANGAIDAVKDIRDVLAKKNK